MQVFLKGPLKGESIGTTLPVISSYKEHPDPKDECFERPTLICWVLTDFEPPLLTVALPFSAKASTAEEAQLSSGC